jgi:hypothetical protein
VPWQRRRQGRRGGEKPAYAGAPELEGARSTYPLGIYFRSISVTPIDIRLTNGVLVPAREVDKVSDPFLSDGRRRWVTGW